MSIRTLGEKYFYYLIYFYIIILPLVYSETKLFGITFNGDRLLALIVFLYACKVILLQEPRARFRQGLRNIFHDYLDIFFLALVGVMFLSTAWAVGNHLVALKDSGKYFLFFALYFIIKNDITDRGMTTRIMQAYIAVVLLAGLYGILQYVSGWGYVLESDAIKHRVESGLENSNIFGIFLVIAIFPLITLTLKERVQANKFYYGLIALITFVNIILTFSRNAWIGLAIGVALLTLLFSIRFVIAIIFLGGLTLLVPQITERVREFTSYAQNRDRLLVWKIAWQMIKDHPILGIGNGNFGSLYLNYAKNDLYDYISKIHAHNLYLNTQTELGIAGSFSLAGLIVSALTSVWKFWHTVTEPLYKNFYAGFFISIIVFLCMNLVDDFFTASKVIPYLWIFLAMTRAQVWHN